MSEDEELSTVEDNGTGEPSDPDPAYDLETYRHALEEARRTWDQELDAFNDVAEKSWRLVRLNGIVATIYIAAVANAPSSLVIGAYAGILIGAGLLLLGISTYLVLDGQQAQEVPVGQSTETFEGVRKHDPDEIVYLIETLKSHEKGIEQVTEGTEQNAVSVNRAKLFFLIGVGLLTTGTLIAVVL